MSGRGCNVDQLRVNVSGNHSHGLNRVDNEQSIVFSGSASDSLKVDAKSRSVLNLADRNNTSFLVYQACEFVQINPTVTLLTHPYLYTQDITDSQPRIDI